MNPVRRHAVMAIGSLGLLAGGRASRAQLAPRGGEPIRRGGMPVVLTSDLLRLTIDPDGAVVTRAEMSLTGEVLCYVSPTRVFVAQSGIVGQDTALPNHRTPFAFVPGPVVLGPSGDLRASFVASSGGVRLTKVFVLTRGSHLVRVEHEVLNEGSVPVTPSVYVQVMRDGNNAGARGGPVVLFPDRPPRRISFDLIESGQPALPKPEGSGAVAIVQGEYLVGWSLRSTQRDFYTRPVDKNLYSIGMLAPLPALRSRDTAKVDAFLYLGPEAGGARALVGP